MIRLQILLLLAVSSIPFSSSWVPSYYTSSSSSSRTTRIISFATTNRPKGGEDDDIVDVEFEKVSHDDLTSGTFDFSQFENAQEDMAQFQGGVGDQVQELGRESIDFSQFENVDMSQFQGLGGGGDGGDVQELASETISNFDLSQLETPGGDRERPTIPKELLEAMNAEEEVVAESKKRQAANAKIEESSYVKTPKTLMDLSLDAGDPMWKEARIPFCRGMEYIDGKLAFLTDIEGETYGIGMPFDHAVAIVQVIMPNDGDANSKDNKKKNNNKQSFQDVQDSNIRYIDPDKYEEEEDSQELMELMANQVQEQLGDDLLLRKTPKVLTISGDLGKFTDNWERNLMDEPVEVKDLMEGMDDFVNNLFGEDKNNKEEVDPTEDKEMQELYSFFRKELGDEEFEKTMKEDMSDEDMELAKLFEFDLDESDFAETPEEDTKKTKEEALAFHPESDGVALKLIAFEFGDQSKSYQLVKLLQPVPLVGRKLDLPVEEGIRFELLTPQEEEVIIPKLQSACQEDLQKAGLSFDDLQAQAEESS